MEALRQRSAVFVILAAILAMALSAAAQSNAPPPDMDEPPGADIGSLFGKSSAPTDVVKLHGQFTTAKPGVPARLFITATILPGWHIYSITQRPGGPTATKIQITPTQGAQIVGNFQASPPPKLTRETAAYGDLPIESHENTVTWYAPLELAGDIDPSKLTIRGTVLVQPCDAGSCLPPTQIPFVAKLGPGVDVPTALAETPPPAATPEAFDPSALRIAENDQLKQTSMALAVAMALLGGLILNLMPCVLPVIGLKILSFVEQSGHSRQHAFALNVWYSLGLLSVFLVLATLAVTLGLGWGQLFSYNAFNITLAAVVFVMGLSFLGVWEIPIPGFVGRGKAVDLAEQEGFAGAFSKGILTTILATPCSAPFLAPALTWAVGQPPAKTYAVFAAVGLGMASPYLLIGAFPRLIAFLPKPGAWMDTFKQVMGFLLLGTVVFLLTFIPIALVVPTVGLLFGLWGACWWIGRTPPTVDANVRLRAWLSAAAFAGAVWIVTFGWLANVMQTHFERAVEQAIAGRLVDGQSGTRAAKEGLPWQPYTPAALESAIASGDTVLVDFTADWCLTCKTLEATVLNSAEISKAVKQNNVVTLQADWTHGQPDVTKMLEALGSKQVPVLAIFSADKPNEPIVLRGGYTRQSLLDALKKAGPSKRL